MGMELRPSCLFNMLLLTTMFPQPSENFSNLHRKAKATSLGVHRDSYLVSTVRTSLRMLRLYHRLNPTNCQ